jgi:hypothetical protein
MHSIRSMPKSAFRRQSTCAVTGRSPGAPHPGFQHIRHYGFLANRYRETKLAHCRQLLHLPPPIVEPSAPLADYRDQYQKLTGQSLRDCPLCGNGHMLLIDTFPVASLSPARLPDTS